MPFIQNQKLKRGADGHIFAGSAALVESIYVPAGQRGGSGHSRRRQLEKLGRVLYLSADGRCGIFLSEQRGLACYDAARNTFARVQADDPRLSAGCSAKRLQTALNMLQKQSAARPRILEFGRSWFLLSLMQRLGLCRLLSELFPDEALRARLYCHLLHQALRSGSKISCEDFTAMTYAAALFPKIELQSLNSDGDFYAQLGRGPGKTELFSRLQELLAASFPEVAPQLCCPDRSFMDGQLQDEDETFSGDVTVWAACAADPCALEGLQLIRDLAQLLERLTGFELEKRRGREGLDFNALLGCLASWMGSSDGRVCRLDPPSGRVLHCLNLFDLKSPSCVDLREQRLLFSLQQ